jgi:hypothetical protein
MEKPISGSSKQFVDDQQVSRASCVETTIQGRRVTIVKHKNKTYFTFWSSEDTSEANFMAAYGSQDPDFVYGLLRQLANVGSDSPFPDDDGFKFALSAVRGLAPRDAVEAMIASQMVVVHGSAMKFANRLAHAESPAEMESAERTVNRLLRTHCALVEALNRYRNGADQKVSIEHMSLAEGAQAIVGNVTPRHRKSNPKEIRVGKAGLELRPEDTDKAQRSRSPLRRSRKVNGHSHSCA